MSPVRAGALVKFGIAIGFCIVVALLIRSLEADGTTVPGKLKAIPAFSLVLSLVPALEFALNARFLELGQRWSQVPSWEQWLILLLVLFAFFGTFVLITALHHVATAA